MESLTCTTSASKSPTKEEYAAEGDGELYIRWEEVRISRDNERKEVHYYLKRRDGGLDLAVIGKEKCLRHMSYKNVLLRTFKLKSRREVIDWLNSIVSDSLLHESSQLTGFFDISDSTYLDIEDCKDVLLENLANSCKEFRWLDSPWRCRKQRKHYLSFQRNGVKISVDDFVYVLAEENKRLVAYLEDMYEDSKGNKMVVVRWFHKIDEVGFDFLHKFNDREIFFSLCHQDLNIECIDGLATVLSPQHFEKFHDKAIYKKWDPFVCYKQFENDDIRPFDITRVRGYWEQEIFRSSLFASKVNGLKVEGDICDDSPGPKKRVRLSIDDVCIQRKDQCGVVTCNSQPRWIEYKSLTSTGCAQGVKSSAFLSTALIEQSFLQCLQVGSDVEVLSQDSGIRGCWFRATIIKKHKDKVKVRYQDLKDASDEAKQLEEWISSSRTAVADNLGIRICGRTSIRPSLEFNKGWVSCVVYTGTVVDVWWHGGWWEGIVLKKEREDAIHVYFPGEKKESVFGRAEMRHSQEWLGNRWMHIKDRPDIVTSKVIAAKYSDIKLAQAANPDTRESAKAEAGISESCLDLESDNCKRSPELRDLLKDDILAQLRWMPSRKRKRNGRRSAPRVHDRNYSIDSLLRFLGYNARERFPISTMFKVDNDNCKYMEDSPFTSAVVQSMTNLVLSRFSHYSEEDNDMAPAKCPKKEMPKQRFKSKSMLLPGTNSLASMESLTMPLVQEVVVSADIRCSECQKRVADIISRMTEVWPDNNNVDNSGWSHGDDNVDGLRMATLRTKIEFSTYPRMAKNFHKSLYGTKCVDC